MDLGSRVTVVLARFEDLINAGLRSFIERDASLRIVASEVDPDDLDPVIAEWTPRVALLNLPTPGECSQLLALGATACLGKEVQARDVLNAIHLASRGLHVLPHGAPIMPTNGIDVLTPREADVLDQLQLGRSNGEIAAALSVSIETIRTHARSVFRKLGVHNRRELTGLSSR